MLKKCLINNAIALSMYILSTALLVVVLSFTEVPEAQYGFLLAILYMLGGFFLIPIKKLSFLSVISISVLLISLFVAFYLSTGEGDSWIVYYVFNPIVFTLDAALWNTAPAFLFTLVVYLSAVLPSLLFYLGMLLRRLIVKAKKG